MNFMKSVGCQNAAYQATVRSYNFVRQMITFSNDSNIVVLCQNSLSMEYQNWNSPAASIPHDTWMILLAYHLLIL